MLKSFAFFWLVLSTGSASTVSSLPQMRMTVNEVRARAGQTSPTQIGSSKLAGVKTTTLYGDPSKAEFYTILLYVPAHTSIPAHSHRDNRMATVLSGSWSFGYGPQFTGASLKSLPPGSVYSEPAGNNHFAQTGDIPAIVAISGFGPTDTVYVDAANDPTPKKKQ